MSRRLSRRVIGLVVAACLVSAATACSDDGGTAPSTTTAAPASTAPTATIPALSEQQTYELQARAMRRAWHSPRLCIAEDNAPAGLRAALESRFEEVLYVALTGGGGFTPSVGWGACTLVAAGSVVTYRPGVVGVDVGLLWGFLAGTVETYLFRWEGSAWVDATPEETGVTVTTSVS